MGPNSDPSSRATSSTTDGSGRDDRWKLARTVGICAAGFLGVIVLGLAYFALTLPSPSSVRRPPQQSLVLETSGGASFAHRGVFHGGIAAVSDLPKHLVDAVIAIEDRRFFDHIGIDATGIARAAARNLASWEIREGGSTITQQLAKNEYLDPERSLGRKIQEAMIALWMETRWDKNEILKRYLNRVYFGAGAYGISAAARRYFGKTPDRLSLAESAMLAGLIKAPSHLAPTTNPAGARKRAGLVLDAMVANGALTPARKAGALTALAALKPNAAGSPGSNYFADWIQDRTRRTLGPTFGTFTVRTTLTPKLQAIAERAIEKWLARKGAARNATQAALVALATDGAVLAMVGGRNYRASQFNRATQARRQPGSLFKLFVYRAALENGYSLHDILVDRPVRFGDWAPRNFTKRHRGAVTLEEAFAYSINSVAAQLGNEVGPAKILATARDMGIQSPLDPTPSLSLGASEVTLLEITAAYAAVLRGTRRVRPYGIREIRSGSAMLHRQSAQTADGTTALPRRDDLRRLLQGAVRFGTARRAAIDRDAAGKTGTSQGHRDAWFVGFVSGLVVGVWVGNDDNAAMKGVTGGGLPTEIWRDVVREARKGGHGAAPPTLLAKAIPNQTAEPPAEPAPVEREAPAQGSGGADPLEQMDIAKSSETEDRHSVVTGVPRVESTATLRFGHKRIRLIGVRGAAADHAAAMNSYIGGRRVVCRPFDRHTHRCKVDGYDLSEVVLFNGGGRATADAPGYLRAAEAKARYGRKGLWYRR